MNIYYILHVFFISFEQQMTDVLIELYEDYSSCYFAIIKDYDVLIKEKSVLFICHSTFRKSTLKGANLENWPFETSQRAPTPQFDLVRTSRTAT